MTIDKLIPENFSNDSRIVTKKETWLDKLKNNNEVILDTREDKCDFINVICDEISYIKGEFDFQQQLACETVSRTLKENIAYIERIEINSQLSSPLGTLQISIEYEGSWEENICMLNHYWLFVFDYFCSQDVSNTYSADEFIFVFKKENNIYQMVHEGFEEVS